MSQIKLLVTDFDGTLVDTFEANFLAYQKAFSQFGLNLTEQQYQDCFGFRFDDFMEHMGISDTVIKQGIRKAKGDCYPLFFDKLKVNHALLSMLEILQASRGNDCCGIYGTKEKLEECLGAYRSLGSFYADYSWRGC